MNTQQQDQSSKSEKTAGRKRLSILGSTGSIGTQTLQVVDEFPDEFDVVSLSCAGNTELLAQQAQKYSPDTVCIMDPEKAREIEKEYVWESKYSPVKTGLSARPLKAAIRCLPPSPG